MNIKKASCTICIKSFFLLYHVGIVLENAEHPTVNPIKDFNGCLHMARVFSTRKKNPLKSTCKKYGFKINFITFWGFLLRLMLETSLKVA